MFSNGVLSSALCLALLAPSAFGRITVSATGGGTYTLTHLGNNVYELTLQATSTSANTTFTIRRSTADDVLNFIKVDSENDGKSTYLDIGRVASIPRGATDSGSSGISAPPA